ncbi:MAG: hypothetical protein FWD13_09650, partial [Treponema sp.]|nr:hypothetical protein [Treponema sp.]
MNKGLLFKLIGIMVITIIAMACASAPESTATQTKTESGVIDYNKIINGDLSDFAGFWVNGRNERIQLRADGVLVRTNGTFVDGENAVDFRRTESEYLAS